MPRSIIAPLVPPQTLVSPAPLLVAVLLALATAFPAGAGPASAQDNSPSTPDKRSPAADQTGGQSASSDAASENPFPGRFPAPSLDGGTEWLNTAAPLDLPALRGKVVLLDFWTYCCINCMHILPDLKYLERKYPNELVVIGVHAHKFDNEQDADNIRQAILRYEIEHPVVNDSRKIIARKYQMQSWPTLVLIDPEGQYIGYLSGEGHRELLDKVIGTLADYHRQKGTLGEQPLAHHLERDQQPARPLSFPGKLLADQASGRLFVVDSNHNRVVIASLDGTLQDVIGTGQTGTADGPFDTARFDHPQGIVLDGHRLYVADTENHLLRVVDLVERTVTTLAGTGEQARRRTAGGPLGETALNSPWAVSLHQGVLYVAMAGFHQLWAHRLGSDQIELFAGNGREHIADGPRLSAELAQPSGLAHDGQSLFWADSEGSAVRRLPLSGDGAVTTLVGPHDVPHALFEFGDVDGPSERARLQHPLDVAWADGTLYVADTYNHKVKRIDVGTGDCRTLAGTGRAGDELSPLELSEPGGLSVAGGLLYVADTNNHRVLVLDLKTGTGRELTINGLTPPTVTPGND
jgi:thiol-disulfide isomerase/thioredoxin